MIKKIESLFKSFLLKLLLFFFSPKSDKGEISLDERSVVLFIRLNRIGDALVSTPVLKLYKEMYNCKVLVLADKKNHFVYTNSPYVDKVFIFNKGLKGFFTVRNIAKEYNVNLLVDLHDDVSTTVTFLTALSGIKQRIALKKPNYKVFTRTFTRADSKTTHVTDRIIPLANPAGKPDFNPNDINIDYFPIMDSINFCNDFLQSNVKRNKFLVGINISAGSDARFWGKDNFVKLITLFHKYDAELLIISAPKDLDKAKEIEAETGTPVFCSQNFDQFASMVSLLNFLFTPDSSIIHLASVWQVPLFGLYVKYNTDDIIWYPYKSDYETIITGKPNLKNVKFEDVKNKLLPFFNKVLNETNTRL